MPGSHAIAALQVMVLPAVDELSARVAVVRMDIVGRADDPRLLPATSRVVTGPAIPGLLVSRADIDSNGFGLANAARTGAARRVMVDDSICTVRYMQIQTAALLSYATDHSTESVELRPGLTAGLPLLCV